MKNKVVAFLLITTFLVSAFGGKMELEAITQSVDTKTGITYPVSLSTGRDANGRLVIPDKGFLTYIAEESFRGGQYRDRFFDLNGDGQLSEDECNLVRVLEINGRRDIGSVEGIALFPKLRELRCGNTGIHSINLSYNPRLKELALYGNDLTELDISGCPLLSSLDIHNSAIGSLDLSSNHSLEYLVLDNQMRTMGQYREDGKYVVDLQTLDSHIDISRISGVRIDGAEGDGINSIYDEKTGTIVCSDEIRQVTYSYDTGYSGTSLKEGSRVLEVTLNLALAYRELYQTNGGSRVPSQYVIAGNQDIEPDSPIRAGYCFTGWYTKESCETSCKWNFGQTLTKNITLYAGWQKKTYKVHYNTDGGFFDKTIEDKEVDWWTTGLLPASLPAKRGYRLYGWKTDSGDIVKSDNDYVTYGEIAGNSEINGMVLTAVWDVKKGYCIAYDTCFTDKRSKQVEAMPENDMTGQISWDSKEFVDLYCEPILKGNEFLGWYTAKDGGIKVSEETSYGDIYASQFTGDATGNTPVLYARFRKKKFTVYYDERGGSKVQARKDVLWGSKNLLPFEKTKKKNYVFAGWKCNGKKVTKKTSISTLSDGYEDAITLTAVWNKKYEKKGKIFKRYGCKYKVTQSNKKGNKIRLIGVTKKKVTIRNKVFYNGKFFTLSGIEKKALKKTKKVIISVPKKQKNKYAKMIKRGGGRVSV